MANGMHNLGPIMHPVLNTAAESLVRLAGSRLSTDNAAVIIIQVQQPSIAQGDYSSNTEYPQT